MQIRAMVFAAFLGLAAASPAVSAQTSAVKACREKPTSQAAYQCLKQVLESTKLEQKHSAENLSLVLKRIDGVYAPKIDAVRKFKSAHDEWKEYRDKECGFAGAVVMWGGSGAPQAVLECLIETTDKRTEQYSELTDELKITYLN